MIAVELRRALDVKTWLFTGEVARPVARTWEIAVVQLATDAPAGITPTDVCRDLLAGRSRTIGERLLEICVRLGLLAEEDGRFRATDAGRVAAASGKVHVPEYGTWILRAARDPLLTSPVLEIAEAPPAAGDTFEGGDRGRPRLPERLPDWVREVRGRDTSPVLGGGVLRIDDFGAREMGEPRSDKTALSVVLTVSAASTDVRVEGRIGGNEVAARIQAPPIDFCSVWGILLAENGLEQQWDAERGCLRTTFDTIDDQARRTQETDLNFPAPEVPGIGSFDDATVPRVKLFPASVEDASAWSTWRLRRLVTEYASADRWAKWVAEATEPFADMAPVVPSRRELARLLRLPPGAQPTADVWHVVAAEDWEL